MNTKKLNKVSFDTEKHGVVHSGHFMSTHVHDSIDEYSDVPVPSPDADNAMPIPNANEVVLGTSCVDTDVIANKSSRNLKLDIELNLDKLLKCIKSIFRGCLISPKWKNFKGFKLTWKDKIRLNNIIWRIWHQQYIKRVKPSVICLFTSETDTNFPRKQTVEKASFWKQKRKGVKYEYKKWRRNSKSFLHKSEISNTNSFYKQAEDKILDMFVDSPFLLSDEIDIPDTLFSTFFSSNSKDGEDFYDINGNADLFQPNMGQMHTEFDFSLLNCLDSDVDPMINPNQSFNTEPISNDIPLCNYQVGSTPENVFIPNQLNTLATLAAERPPLLNEKGYFRSDTAVNNAVCTADMNQKFDVTPFQANPMNQFQCYLPPSPTVPPLPVSGNTVTMDTKPGLQQLYVEERGKANKLKEKSRKKHLCSVSDDLPVASSLMANQFEETAYKDIFSKLPNNMLFTTSKQMRLDPECSSPKLGLTSTLKNILECNMSPNMSPLSPFSPMNQFCSAEERRRFSIKSSFDTLRTIVPSVLPNVKHSKASMLQKTSEYIVMLQDQIENSKKEMDFYEQEMKALQYRISEYQNQLPPTGLPMSRKSRTDEGVFQMLDEYVRERTAENWQFYLFSFIVKPLYDSFNRTVRSSSISDLKHSIITWQNNYLNLTNLRPLAAAAIREICLHTSILNEPTSVPQQCRDAVAKL